MRAIALKSQEQLDRQAEDLGFEIDPDVEADEHPLEIENAGDIRHALKVAKSIQEEIEQEKQDRDEEIEAVKEFRNDRIEKKKDTLDWLTIPLKRYLNQRGSNYNGDAGHAGFHTVTSTEYHADDDELLEFALDQGTKVKVQIKSPITREQLEILQETFGKDAISITPYKSSIKDRMRDLGLHAAEYGHGPDMNPIYEQVKRKDFRVKPE